MAKKLPTKAKLKEELLAVLEDTVRSLSEAHKSTTEGMTHPDNKPENDKDTRMTEMSYLARGQAMRLEELMAGVVAVKQMKVAECTKIALGALVHTEDDDGAEAHYFVAGEGGGTLLAGGAVKVVTPKSPLGKALLGKSEGDEASFVAGAAARVLSILGVD